MATKVKGRIVPEPVEVRYGLLELQGAVQGFDEASLPFPLANIKIAVQYEARWQGDKLLQVEMKVVGSRDWQVDLGKGLHSMLFQAALDDRATQLEKTADEILAANLGERQPESGNLQLDDNS